LSLVDRLRAFGAKTGERGYPAALPDCTYRGPANAKKGIIGLKS
jgi:hypothetical protein